MLSDESDKSDIFRFRARLSLVDVMLAVEALSCCAACTCEVQLAQEDWRHRR